MRRSLSLAILALLLFSPGCKTSEERKLQKESATSQPEPLSLDPTDQFKLSGWWSNGSQLLQLRDDAGYTLFSQLSRYSPVMERGRWAKMSYAVVRLEPYNTPEVTSTRVGITRTDGKITLHVRDLPPFTAINQPPATRPQ